jgi:cytoskeletal protein CcmA (bactofilin family)
MNPSLALFMLVLLAGVLFTLPMLPAIVELRFKRDAKPLGVIQQYGGDIRHFADGFRTYLAELKGPLQQCVGSGTTVRGILPHGDEYVLLGSADTEVFLNAGKKQPACAWVVAAGTDIALSGGLTFLKEIYAAGQFLGGEGGTYRALLGEKDICLGPASHITRWAHAAGTFRAARNCDLYGRISADQEIQLQPGCAFQRLNAPRITFGCSSDTLNETSFSPPDLPAETPALPGPRGRTLVEGDFEIRPGEVVAGSVVARGKLRIGAGARVLGSAKSNKEMIVEAGASVEGSLISAATMHIGPRCRIGGPILAEREMGIESGTECGTARMPTTVSALTIELEEGAQVFGTLWARNEGRVVPKR